MEETSEIVVGTEGIFISSAGPSQGNSSFKIARFPRPTFLAMKEKG
jgi:hypothetical protein